MHPLFFECPGVDDHAWIELRGSLLGWKEHWGSVCDLGQVTYLF